MEHIFKVVSSDRTKQYSIVFRLDAATLSVSCDCAAGLLAKLCKHKLALVAGRLEDLVDPEQKGLFVDIQKEIGNTMVVLLAKEIEILEKKVVDAKTALENAKKKLERAMVGS